MATKARVDEQLLAVIRYRKFEEEDTLNKSSAGDVKTRIRCNTYG